MDARLEGLFAQLTGVQMAWATLYKLLKRANYDTSIPKAPISNQTLEMFDREVNFVVESLAALKPKAPDSIEAIILSVTSHEINEPLQLINSHIQDLSNKIETNLREGFILRDDGQHFNMQLVQPDGGIVTTFAFTSSFESINHELKRLLAYLSKLLPLCKADGVGDLSQRADALARTVQNVTTINEQIQTAASKIATTLEGASSDHNNIQRISEQAQTALNQVQAYLQQATTDVGSVSGLIEKIKTTRTDAGSLEQQINTYQINFDAFQKQLDDKNNQFNLFQENQNIAEQKNSTREGEIDRLIQQADSMISGATTAGLAKAMEDVRARYEERMQGARGGFYFAIFFLILSAIPLAAHLLPNIFGYWFPPLDANADGSLYAVVGKIVLLLPATWLTAFFTKSYADFFHLEREYAHKAALAMSVDGFKRQAPNYEQEITAEVFLEVRDNPAKGRPIEAAKHPFQDVLSKVLESGQKK